MVDVLQARSMPATVEEEGGAFVVWIQNDDDREPARRLLVEFQANPDAREFSNAEETARQKEAAAKRAAKARQRLQVNIRDRWNGVWYRCYPATMILIGICVFTAIVCTDGRAMNSGGLFGWMTCNDEMSEFRNSLFIQAPSGFKNFNGREKAVFGEPDLMATLMSGQVWRIFTPMFLHFGVLHILFNMLMLRNLGTAIEFARGTRRFLQLVLICAATSNIAQLLMSGPGFGGMSGVVFGLIGYLWMKGKFQPHLGLGLMPNQVVYYVLWMLLCIGGAFGSIANTAHVVGMAVGMLIGARQTIWKKLVVTLRNPPGGADS